MASTASLISLDPPELVFGDVLLNKAYSQQVHVANNLSIAVTLAIRPGSPQRYSVLPASLTLAPGTSAPLVVTLKVIKFGDRKKAENVGQRDIFHIKSSYFDQKFFATFFLAPLVPPAHPSSHYGGLLSADEERHSGRSPLRNRHRREGLEVPHSSIHSQREGPDAEGRGPEARRIAASLRWGDGALPFLPPQQARACDEEPQHQTLPAGGGRPPSAILGRTGTVSSQLPAMGGLASPPSSVSPPRSREMLASSPRWQQGERTGLVAGIRGGPENSSQGDRMQEVRWATEPVLEAATQEKDEIIAALKAQLVVRERRSVRHEGSDPPSAALEARLTEVEGANDALRSRMREVTAEVGALRTERTMLVQMQESLEAVTPDAAMLAEAARVRERAHALSREEKVVAALSAKDAALGCLERDMEAAGVALAGMRCSMEEMGSALEASEARVVALLEERQGAREQARAERQEQARLVKEARTARDAAEQRAQQAESHQATLQARVEEQAARLDELSRANAALTAQLQEARDTALHASHASARISQLEAEAVASVAEPATWRRALAEAEEALSAKDELVAQMENMLSQQMERIRALTNHVQAGPSLAMPAATTKSKASSLGATSIPVGPSSDGADLPPEPRCARPTLPQGPASSPAAVAREDGNQADGVGPPVGSTYSTLMTRGAHPRRNFQRPLPVSTSAAGNAASLSQGGKSGPRTGAVSGGPDASLVARAEAVEVAARRVEAQVKQVAEKREADGMSGDAKQARGQQALLAVQVEQLRIQVVDLQRELAVTTAGVAQRERRLLDLKETAVRRALAATATHAAELGTVTRRAAEAERNATVARLEAQQLREEVQAARAATERARAAADSSKAAGERRAASLEETVRKLQEEALTLRRSAEQAASVADEKSAAVSVLLESVETLHSGCESEREQRLVSLTAQLAGAQAVQAALERRAAQLQDEVRQAGQARTSLCADVDRLRAAVKQREQRLAQRAAEVETLRRNMTSLRAEVRERDAATEGLVREGARLKEALRMKTDEVESRATVAEQQQQRLHAQLQSERTEAAADLRAVHDELAQAAQDTVPPAVAARLQQLLDDAHGTDAVIGRLSSAVVETERQLSHARVEGRLSAGDAARLRSVVTGLEGSLDRCLGEWQVAEGRLCLAHARREARQADEEGWAEARGALLRVHVDTLGAQLERAHQDLAGVRGELAAAVQEGAQQRDRAARLSRKLLVVEADLVAMRDGAREADAEGGQEVGGGEADEAVKAWVEEQVVRVLLRADPQEKLVALSRELAALKLANGHLQATLAHARQKQDAAVSHAAALHHVVDQLEARLDTADAEGSEGAIGDDVATSAGSPAWSIAELAARLAAKGQEVYALQDEGLALRQSVSRLEADLSEALGEHAASSGAQARQREQAEAAAAARADDVAAAHRAELRAMAVEREAEARAHRQERAAMQQEKVRVLEAAQAEVAAAMATVQAQLTEALRQQATLQEAEQDAQRIPLLEQQLQQADAENQHLAARLAAVSSQLASLEDERELRAGVASDLERLVARLEHAGAGGPARGSGGRAAVAGGSLAAVSKQLVQAKLAEADAQRKLRVSARAELELRQVLADREKRIDELKQGRNAIPARCAPSVSEAGEEAVSRAEGRDGRTAQHRSVVDLRIEVAKKEAAIAGLQAALADATANSRRQDADLRDLFRQRDDLEAALDAARHSERQLRRHVAWLEEDHVLTAAAITSAVVADGAGTLTRPPPKGPLTLAVQKLVQRLRDKDLALRKMRQRKAGGASGETEAGAGGAIPSEQGLPLVESQTCVIRELSARVASLLQERSRLHARLATTHARPPTAHSDVPLPPPLAEPPLPVPDAAPLSRVASWPDRLSPPRHRTPALLRGSPEVAPPHLAPPAARGAHSRHAGDSTPGVPRPHPQSSTHHAPGELPSEIHHSTEAAKAEAGMRAKVENTRLQEVRMEEDGAVATQQGPLHPQEEEAAAQPVGQQPVPAVEAATVSALCDLLLHHVEALEASKSDVHAAAAGAVALRDADATDQGKPAKSEEECETGSSEEAHVEAMAVEESGLEHSGLHTSMSGGSGLRVLPEQLEATAGAMASELSAMRAALAVLAQGMGSLQARTTATEGLRGTAIGTQTDAGGCAEAAVQTVEIEAVESGMEDRVRLETHSVTVAESAAQTQPNPDARSDGLAQTDTVETKDTATQSDFLVAVPTSVLTSTGLEREVPMTGPMGDASMTGPERDAPITGLERKAPILPTEPGTATLESEVRAAVGVASTPWAVGAAVASKEVDSVAKGGEEPREGTLSFMLPARPMAQDPGTGFDPLLAAKQHPVSAAAIQHASQPTCEDGAHVVDGGDAHCLPGISADTEKTDLRVGPGEVEGGNSQTASLEQTATHAGNDAEEQPADAGTTVVTRHNSPRPGLDPTPLQGTTKGNRQEEALQFHQDPGPPPEDLPFAVRHSERAAWPTAPDMRHPSIRPAGLQTDGRTKDPPVPNSLEQSRCSFAVSDMPAGAPLQTAARATSGMIEAPSMLRVDMEVQTEEEKAAGPFEGRLEVGSRRKAEGHDKGSGTEAGEVAERGAQTSLEVVEQSAGPGPGAEAAEVDAARQIRVHLKAAQAAVDECPQWQRRCVALRHEAVEAAAAAHEREALLRGGWEQERRGREEAAREHSKQVAAATASAHSTEAALQAALASERVAVQEARHALQSVAASQASAEARVAELEVRSAASSGVGARLAAGAAAMAAVQKEVAVLKAVVGSERQEHRQLVDALRGALTEAKAAQKETEQRGTAEQARLKEDLAVARTEQQWSQAAAHEGEQALARQVAVLQQKYAAEAAAVVQARAQQQQLALQLDETQRLLQDARHGLAARQSVAEAPEERHQPERPPPSSLSDDSNSMEQGVDAQQRNSARQQQQWARLARAHRYSQLLRALRAQHQRCAADAAKKVAGAEAAVAAAVARGQAAEVAGAQDREALVEQHIAHLQEVEAKMVAAQTRWQDEVSKVRSKVAESVAQAEAAGAAALAAARERWAAEAAVERKSWQVKVEAARVYAREREAERDEARAALVQCEELRERWQHEGQAAVARLQREHRRYRALKERAVQALEARLQELARTPHPACPGHRPGSPPTHDWEPETEEFLSPGPWARAVEATADAVRSLAESEGLRAMAGELQYARQEKQELQAQNQQLRAQLAAVNAELVALKRSSTRELGALQARLRAAQKQAAEHSPEAWQQQAAALSTCQLELKAARAEAARKGRLLSGLEGDAKQRAAATAAETEARVALEAELVKARLAHTRQAALVKELHRKLEAAAGVDRDASGDRQRLGAAEERVRSLSAALARKEAALKDARAHAGAGGKEAAAAAVAAQEKEGLQAAVKKWQGEAGRRETALRACHTQLDLARQERAAAVASAAEHVSVTQRLLDGARDELSMERAASSELGTLAAALVRTGARAVRALQASSRVALEEREAGNGVTSEGSEEWRDASGEAAATAELVQLRLDEVRHVMSSGRGAVVRGAREEPLACVVAEVERARLNGSREKGAGRVDKARAITEALHKALAMIEQEVRWGEAAAASA